MFKKTLVAGLLAFSLFLAPVVNADTTSDLQAQINAILAKIQNLQAQINSAQGGSVATEVPVVSVGGSSSTQTSTVSACFNFSRSLSVGSRFANDVTYLTSILSNEGFLGGKSDVYDEDVAAAVVDFQEKYGIKKTGTVGPITRAKLNSLYGCATKRSSEPTATIIGSPTLELAYDSNNKESLLSATFNVVVTAGSSDLTLYTNSANAGLYDQNGSQASTNSMRMTVGVGAGEKSDAYGRNYTILSPGNSVRLTVTLASNPKQMFAGSYYAKLNSLYFLGRGSDINNLSQLYVTAQTNSKTIIGEVSPYITSAKVADDGMGGLYLQGVRFSGTNNLVTIGTQEFGVLSTNGGTSIGLTKLPSPGSYPVFVTNMDLGREAGKSNVVWVQVGESGSSTNNPVISGVSGPQALSVNEQGTWTIKAYSPNGGNLSYSVAWGDENVYPTATTNTATAQLPSQSATFTHSYRQAGTYTPTFIVTSPNTIACIQAPCPSNGGSAKTSLTVRVGATTNVSSITLLSPNGGEYWKQGTTQTIIWRDNTAYPKCEISQPCAMPAPKYYDVSVTPYYTPCTGQICPAFAYHGPYTITKNAYGSSIQWNVGRTADSDSGFIPEGAYTIQVCQTGTSICDSSDSYFKITSSVSTDSKTQQIIALYKKLLAREPESAGLNYWLNGGLDISAIEQRIKATSEYAGRRESIRQLYLSLLKREPEQLGWDYWANNGLTIAEIKAGIYASPEYRDLYRTATVPTCSLTSNKDSYVLGETITYTWTSPNATYAYWQQDTSGKDHLSLPGDKLAGNGSTPVVASVVGNPPVTLSVGNSSGNGSCSKTVGVTATTPSAPIISSLSPVLGAVGDSIMMNGSNFNSNSKVYFGTTVVTPSSIATDGSGLKFNVPASASAGTYYVYTTNGSTYSSNSVMFTVAAKTTTTDISVAPADRKAQISNLYRTLLNREPDQAGLDYFNNSGMTIEQIKATIMNSSEYVSLHSSSI